MQNNEVKALEVAIPDRKPSFKDKSATTHITMDFGTVVPGHFERIYQDTEFSVGDRERCILTSLVAPCFGDLSLKSYSYFVPFSALTRNYSAMMAQQAVSRSVGSSFVPQSMPSVTIRQLSMFVLTGAQLSVYSYNRNTNQYHLYALPANQPVNDSLSNLPSVMQASISNLGIDFNGSELGTSNSCRLYLAWLLGWTTSKNDSLPLTLGNLYPSTLFDARVNHPDTTIPNVDPVGLGEGQFDYVVPVSVEVSGSSVDYILAFRLSSFGRRLRKVLIGLGWQFSLTSQKFFDVMRLVAWYCAYFELFQPKRYKNWEQTFAYKVMQISDLSPTYNWFCWNSSSSYNKTLREFILNELGFCFYTDPMDFVAAHNKADTVAPSMQVGVNSALQVNVANVTNIIDPDSSSDVSAPSSTSYHASITTVTHGALDEKLLMRLYRTTNVCTPAGRRIDELCRAQGLGPDMEKVKAKFIGFWELDLNIYDLPAQSDTYNKVSEEGKQLGEFGAYGKTTGTHEKVHYKTSEDGYFINLICVVPKGGYCETVDPSATRLTKFDQFNPIFDSLGYQFNTKDETVLGSITWQQTGYEDPTGTTDGELTDSFGLAPRYFEKKFGRNVINGDFSLNSKRNAYSQWNLEKLLSANDHKIQNIARDPSGNETGIVTRMNKPADLPVAGDVWRYAARYEWLSRFNRIFYNSYSTFSGMTGIADSVRTAMYELFSLRDDNFVLHIRYDIAVYDRMLPVQQSFETDDEEQKANSKMSKA